MLFLFFRFDFYLQYGGGERGKAEYDIRQRKKSQRCCLNSFNSISLLNSLSPLLLRPNLVAYESVVKDEEETRDADPVRGLERGAILYDTT